MVAKGEAQKIVDEVSKGTKSKKSKKKDLKISWKKLSLILGALLVISVVINLTGASGYTAGVSEQDITQNVETFLESNYAGIDVEILEVTEKAGLYEISLNVKSEGQSQRMISYATKDSTLLFPTAIPMSVEAATADQPTQQPPAQDITKSDKPKVELFVMSHCPFGTQSEKGLIPVAELLGDKIDFDIKFVNYAMHGEKEVNEQSRQVCIAEEQSDKYFDYLWCFLDSDDYETCLTTAKVDTAKVDACVTKLDTEFKITEMLNDKASWSGGRFPQFLVHDAENKQYGVRGSPTLVINGQQVSSARDSASYLATVCSAFNNAPEECSEQLSSVSPSSGFGLDSTGAASAATCG
jgi:hypothetical protein